MHIVANTDVCVGAAQCVLTEPAVFDQDSDGTVTVLVERPEGDQARSAQLAVELCPSRALSVED
ncbi:ferredoxin [Nonomuraea sp. NPDC049714]|uniref:ferredoxin n=1 Tax=Nonomuraea sp. NPDC049714 TaxID=3364357 RepID=UPI0037B95AFD